MKWIKRAAVLLAAFWVLRLFWISASRLNDPWDVHYESPNVNTAVLLDRQMDIYSNSVYDSPPFNLTLYTPAFFALVRQMPWFHEAPFQTGRAVSIFFALCLLILLTSPVCGKRDLTHIWIAVGWLSLLPPYVTYVSYFRMDVMGLFFSAASIAVLLRRDLSMMAVVISGLLAGMGILTKQSFVAAPLASILYLMWRSPGYAVVYIVTLLLMTAAVMVIGDADFIWCVFTAPRNPFSIRVFVANWLEMDILAFYVLLILSAICCLCLFRRATPEPTTDTARWPARLIGVYYLTGWVWLVVSIGKVGAAANYFLEPLYSSVWVILAWQSGMEGNGNRRGVSIAWTAILASFAWPMISMDYSDPCKPKALDMAKTIPAVRREIAEATTRQRPKILNMVTPRVSLSAGFDLYLNDPALYAILWNTHTLSNRSILKTLDDGYFDVVMLANGSRPRMIEDPTPLGEVYNKIYETCEFRHEGIFAYYVPRQSTRIDNPGGL